MNLKKLNILLLLFISVLSLNSIFYASETESQVDDRFVPAGSLENSVQKAVKDTNFNGSIMISKSNGSNYDVLYEGAAGSDGGYDIDTIYDVGSISKLYTTTAIMMLQEDGKLEYSDKIGEYIDNVPADKQDVTIKMLLTHTSGIYAEENDNHDVSKENEIKRILNQDLKFSPGTNYLYSNSGFTLLAAIVEAASDESYEDYLTENIFEPLGLESTGFPNSNYLKDKPAVSGTLNDVNYGKVTNFDFGWYSKGYADILTTPRELTYFFQALINGKLLNSDNLKLMDLDEVDLGSDMYRGYGTDIKHVGTKEEIVGHSGIWYGGNSIVYYRPADKILFVMACDQLNVETDLPANYVFNTLNAMYPAGEFNDMSAVETIEIADLTNPDSESVPEIEVDVSEVNNQDLIEPLSKQKTVSDLKIKLQVSMKALINNKYLLFIILCILLIAIIILTLVMRIRRRLAS